MHRFQLGMSLIFEQALDEQDEGIEMDDLLVRKGVSSVSCRSIALIFVTSSL